MSFEKIKGPLRGKSTRELAKDCYVTIKGHEVRFSKALVAKLELTRGQAFDVSISEDYGILRLIQVGGEEFLNEPTRFVVLGSSAGGLYFRSKPVAEALELGEESLKRQVDTEIVDDRLQIDIYYTKEL